MKKEQLISDKEIIDGLRQRNERLTRDYFYGFCRMAYAILDRQYQLKEKPGLDFYALAHEYYLALDKRDFKPLENRNTSVSLRSWMINGFRFVVLDRLKAYKKEQLNSSFEERVNQSKLEFDLPETNFQAKVREMVEEIANSHFGRDSRQALILKMMLIEGYKGKEIAAELGITPSAVTQQFHHLMEKIVIPYFKNNYQEFAMPCAMSEEIEECQEVPRRSFRRFPSAIFRLMDSKGRDEKELFNNKTNHSIHMEQIDISQRITSERITTLKPDEIFVFGSNLAGMHGGGAARIARLHFGAVMGVGVGLQGQSYAIPTMQGGVDTIQPYVDEFIQYAINHPELHFLVTRIGCGIAGFSEDEIAPLFRQAVSIDNISLPQGFWEQLNLY